MRDAQTCVGAWTAELVLGFCFWERRCQSSCIHDRSGLFFHQMRTYQHLLSYGRCQEYSTRSRRLVADRRWPARVSCCFYPNNGYSSQNAKPLQHCAHYRWDHVVEKHVSLNECRVKRTRWCKLRRHSRELINSLSGHYFAFWFARNI
jgi:hypothetical protein